MMTRLLSTLKGAEIVASDGNGDLFNSQCVALTIRNCAKRLIVSCVHFQLSKLEGAARLGDNARPG